MDIDADLSSISPPKASLVVATLPDGYYWFRDGNQFGIIDRIGGKTWRIGESKPMRDEEWDDAVIFHLLLPPPL